jgi:anti-sigma regulatory factor (Ser/Thr protein kinase)
VSRAAAAPRPGLSHLLYPYSGEQQYLAGTLAYVEAARALGATVVIATPGERERALRAQLPDDGSVTFVDTVALGNNPGRLIPAWRDWIDRQTETQSGGAVYGISESVWNGSGAARLSELRYHEWLLNIAFAHAPAWSLLCPYDVEGQPPAAVLALARCHPLVWTGSASISGPDYASASGVYTFDPLGDPVGEYEEMTYALDDLTVLRDKVAHWARAHDFSADRLRDLTLAVSEVATNSIRYGGGRGVMRTWIQDGALVCEFRDTGVITDPLVGRVRPGPQGGGCGLWFVHQICDLVEIRSAPQEGTCVRIHMDLPAVP